MNPQQTSIVDMEAEPILLSFSDAKELFCPETIAVNPYLLLVNAKPDDATIPACVDFNLILSSVMENVGDAEAYRGFIVKQIQLRLGVPGALIHAVKLRGQEGGVALAFPSLVVEILKLKAASRQSAAAAKGLKEKEAPVIEAGDTTGVKEGTLQQLDIRQFSGKRKGETKKDGMSGRKGAASIRRKSAKKDHIKPASLVLEQKTVEETKEKEVPEDTQEDDEPSEVDNVCLVYFFINSVFQAISILITITSTYKIYVHETGPVWPVCLCGKEVTCVVFPVWNFRTKLQKMV